MEDYMKEQNNNTGLSQDSLINLFLHTATKEDLASHKTEVDRRFNEVDRNISEFKSDVNRRFDEVDRRFDEVDRRFGEVDRRFGEIKSDMNRNFDKLYRILYSATGLIITAIIVPIVLPLIKANL